METSTKIAIAGMFLFFLSTVIFANLYTKSSFDVQTLRAQLEELNKELQFKDKSLANCTDLVATARSQLMACRLALADKNDTVELLREAFINYDRLITVESWYMEVNTCDEFVSNYYNMVDILQEVKAFLKENKETLEFLFNDEIARKYGYEKGLDVDYLVSSINTLLASMESDYKYCIGG